MSSLNVSCRVPSSCQRPVCLAVQSANLFGINSTSRKGSTLPSAFGSECPQKESALFSDDKKQCGSGSRFLKQ